MILIFLLIFKIHLNDIDSQENKQIEETKPEGIN